MPTARPTTLEIATLLAEEKVITANLRWRPWGRGWRLEATVLALTSRKTLELRGFVGPANRSYALLLNSIDIRHLCLSPNARHTNRDGQRFDGLHKHRYDEAAGDSIDAYLPADITKPGDVNAEFLDFITECKIRLEGAYQPWLPVDF